MDPSYNQSQPLNSADAQAYQPQSGGAPYPGQVGQQMPVNPLSANPYGLPQSAQPQPVAPVAAQQIPAAPAPQPQFEAPNLQPTPQPPIYQNVNPSVPAPNPAGVVSGTGSTQPAQNAPATRPAAALNSTQNTLQIAEIRDGIVIMNDGSFRSVVMVKSINFDLMSQQEQEGVEYSYQNFLNSLYFPIQIFIRSQKVDLQPYIDKLDKIRTEHDNMLLALLMDDYIDYIDQLSQQTNIMDKKFYMVVPYFPHVEIQKALTQSKNFLSGFMELFNKKEQHIVINEDDLEKAKTELRNRVQSVLSGLQQANIQALPLDTQELIELYYDTYNPDTATRQQLKNFNQLNSDIVTKGQGAAPQAHLQRELG